MSFTYVKYLYAHFNVLRLLESQIIVGATKGVLIITKKVAQKLQSGATSWS